MDPWPSNQASCSWISSLAISSVRNQVGKVLMWFFMIVARILSGRIPLMQLEVIASWARDSHGTLRVQISSVSYLVGSWHSKSSLMGPWYCSNIQTYFPSLACLECSRQDLSDGVLYHSSLDARQLFISYVAGLYALLVYLSAYHTHQGSLVGSQKNSWWRASRQLRCGPLRLSNKINPKKILFFPYRCTSFNTGYWFATRSLSEDYFYIFDHFKYYFPTNVPRLRTMICLFTIMSMLLS
jgi:hypothetical protein